MLGLITLFFVFHIHELYSENCLYNFPIALVIIVLETYGLLTVVAACFFHIIKPMYHNFGIGDTIGIVLSYLLVHSSYTFIFSKYFHTERTINKQLDWHLWGIKKMNKQLYTVSIVKDLAKEISDMRYTSVVYQFLLLLWKLPQTLWFWQHRFIIL